MHQQSSDDETRREFKLLPLTCLSSLTSNSHVKFPVSIYPLLVHVLTRSNDSSAYIRYEKSSCFSGS